MADELTRILNSLDAADPGAAEELVVLVYDELRRLARVKLSDELPGQTLQPTALVHEAWLRLAGDTPQEWNSRAHFFGAAAEAMRRVLVDNARRKLARKRGARPERVDLTKLDLAVNADEDHILLVNEAVERLEAHDPQAAELVKLRFFAGLSQAESAKVLGMPDRSAGRLLAYARAWLFKEIEKLR
jgi:RNA polymerase sigma factor (TIGR02999 family)